jgi:hemoglobin
VGAAEQASLYQRLGGEPRMKVVIGQTIDAVVANPKINQSFKNVNLRRLKAKIVLQICSLTGGGCVYKGDDMKTAHAGLHISEAEMYGLVEELRKALDRNGVGQREKNELLAILAPMKRDVVDH